MMGYYDLSSKAIHQYRNSMPVCIRMHVITGQYHRPQRQLRVQVRRYVSGDQLNSAAAASSQP